MFIPEKFLPTAFRQSERARIVFDYKVVGASQTLPCALEGLDPTRLLLLEQARSCQKSAAPGRTLWRVASYAPNEVLVETVPLGLDFAAFGYILSGMTFVNGAPAPRADYNFRAVPIPAGKSLVRFVYAPMFLCRPGVSLAALLLLIFA